MEITGVVCLFVSENKFTLSVNTSFIEKVTIRWQDIYKDIVGAQVDEICCQYWRVVNIREHRYEQYLNSAGEISFDE